VNTKKGQGKAFSLAHR